MSCLGRWLVNYEEQQKYTGCLNSSRGIVLMQLRVFLVLHLPSARMEIEVKWRFLTLMATEAMGTPLYTHFRWTVGWLIEPHTSPRVPSIFALTETHFRYMSNTLSEEACFSHRSWEVLRLDVVEEGCRFLFLLYKLALHLPCLCSQWYLPTPQSVAAGNDAVKKCNSNQWRKETKTVSSQKIIGSFLHSE